MVLFERRVARCRDKGARNKSAICFETRYVQRDPVIGGDGQRWSGLRGQRTNASQYKTVLPSKGIHGYNSDRVWARAMAVLWCGGGASVLRRRAGAGDGWGDGEVV
jgi:hypothetical protein